MLVQTARPCASLVHPTGIGGSHCPPLLDELLLLDDELLLVDDEEEDELLLDEEEEEDDDDPLLPDDELVVPLLLDDELLLEEEEDASPPVPLVGAEPPPPVEPDEVSVVLPVPAPPVPGPLAPPPGPMVSEPFAQLAAMSTPKVTERSKGATRMTAQIVSGIAAKGNIAARARPTADPQAISHRADPMISSP